MSQIVKMGINTYCDIAEKVVLLHIEKNVSLAFPKVVHQRHHILHNKLKNQDTMGRPRYTSLSPAELKVVRASVNGYRSQQIAEMLGISKRTVDAHKRNIYAKFHVHNCPSMVITVLEEGLLK